VTIGRERGFLRRMRRAPLVLATALLLVAPLPAADVPPTDQAVSPDINLATARDALVVAQDQLRLAGSGKSEVFGDHRRLALELVNTALAEVDAGLRLAAEEAERLAKEAREKAKARPAKPRRRR
jgi:hypothetical protein